MIHHEGLFKHPLKKAQFQEFLAVAQEQGRSMTMFFHRMPTANDIKRMENWAKEVNVADDFLLNIVHVLD